MTEIDPASEKRLTGVDFPILVPATTRWADNDMFGHLNNAVYYQLFDTAINGWLINTTGINVLSAPYVGVVAESGCRFYREIGFPRPVTVGLRVMRLGRSSVSYQLGIIDAEISSATAQPVAAVGHWVHVYIDRGSRLSTPIPEQLKPTLRSALTESPIVTNWGA